MLLSNVKIALRVLRTHRLRSALTMLGIVIGVAAVVAMNAIGSGARERDSGTNTQPRREPHQHQSGQRADDQRATR